MMDVDDMVYGTNAQTSSASAHVSITQSAGAIARSPEKNIPPPPPVIAVDFVESIRGMYRILDLVSEQGSGGLGESILSVSALDCAELLDQSTRLSFPKIPSDVL